jgi:hypothetical protein
MFEYSTLENNENKECVANTTRRQCDRPNLITAIVEYAAIEEKAKPAVAFHLTYFFHKLISVRVAVAAINISIFLSANDARMSSHLQIQN